MTGLINAVPTDKPEEYRNVFVFLETRKGAIVKSSLEMIGIGKEIAEKVKEKLVCILVGNDLAPMAKEAGKYGCDKVLGAESPDLEDFKTMPYAHYAAQFISEEKPNIFLIAATHDGRDLASRIAVKSRTGVTADCTVIDIDPNERILLANRPVYGESTLAEILCKNHRPQMATARPGVFKVPEAQDGRNCEKDIRRVRVDPDLIRKEIIGFRPKVEFDITDADIVVSGGLGLGKKEGFQVLEELAKELGGVVGASRPAVDVGWIDRDHQVGQTGRVVRPKLYIAAGISGKAQHIVGMKQSDIIIAINSDPDAEIAKYSDYFINDDVYAAIPELIKEIRKLKGEKEVEIST